MRRNPWLRIAVTLGAMLFVLLSVASWRYMQSRGVFTAVDAKQPGQCHVVAKLPDITDIAVDQGSGAAFVASRTGGLFRFSAGAAVHLGGTPKDFHPVALSFSRSQLLAVFVQQDGRYGIAVFDVKPDGLSEIGRMSADVLHDPADLAALDGGRFYLVNRHAAHTGFGRWLDDTFLLPRAEVLYYDGMKFVTVAKRLNSPSGLALSPDTSRLYVSEAYPRTLVTFARNDFSGALDNPTVLSIPSGPQKITVARTGSLIVAARPKPGMGQVFRVTGDDVELLYATRSGEIAAAAQLGRHLLIGGSGGLTDCDLGGSH